MTTQFEPSSVEDDLDQDRDRDRAVGAVSVRGRPVRKAPLGWLPWVALALLGILAVASLLIAGNVGDGSESAPSSASPDGAPATTAPPAPAPAAPAASGESAVVAGGRALLPLPGAGLASLVGQPAEGKSVNVQSVVADEGFWVGDDTTNRIFVFLTDQAKATDGESPFQVEAKVALSG